MQVYIYTFEGANIRIQNDKVPNIIIICNLYLSMAAIYHFKQCFTRFNIALC